MDVIETSEEDAGGIDLNAIMSISAQFPQQLKIKLKERAIRNL